MTISKTYWTKLFGVMLIVLLLLDAIETRSLKKAKRKQRAKHCGTKGQPCQPGSRKLCCAEGYTCKATKLVSNLTKSQRKHIKQKGRTCQPVVPLTSHEREIEENHPSVEAHTTPKVHLIPLFRL